MKFPMRRARPLGGASALVASSVGAVLLASAGVSAKEECEIAGIADYTIESTQEGGCTGNIYFRACGEAQRVHRERCSDFCASFKTLGGSVACVGSSSPVAQLFDLALHCEEKRRDQFHVTCQVKARCFCTTRSVE